MVCGVSSPDPMIKAMDFRIADSFADSLGRLTGEEQKSVKTTAFDLQLNPVNPGMSFHKLDRAKDANFLSVRVGSDIRLIVHKTAGSLLLCCVAGSILDWPQHLVPVHPVGVGLSGIPPQGRWTEWALLIFSARLSRWSQARSQDGHSGPGAPGGIRTPDQWLRKPLLYPAELRAPVRIFAPFRA